MRPAARTGERSGTRSGRADRPLHHQQQLAGCHRVRVSRWRAIAGRYRHRRHERALLSRVLAPGPDPQHPAGRSSDRVFPVDRYRGDPRLEPSSCWSGSGSAWGGRAGPVPALTASATRRTDATGHLTARRTRPSRYCRPTATIAPSSSARRRWPAPLRPPRGCGPRRRPCCLGRPIAWSSRSAPRS